MSEHRASIEWRFEGDIRVPAAAAQHAELHERAHEKRFIANSVRSELVVEPGID